MSCSWVPEGKLASVRGEGQLTPGLCVKQAETGSFCPLFDPAARDPCSPAFLSLCLAAFFPKISW